LPVANTDIVSQHLIQLSKPGRVTSGCVDVTELNGSSEVQT